MQRRALPLHYNPSVCLDGFVSTTLLLSDYAKGQPKAAFAQTV